MASVAVRQSKNFVGGEWVAAASGLTFESVVPATGEVLGAFPRSAADDVDRAVAAAKAAFMQWRLVPAPERGTLLLRFAQLLERDKQELTELMSRGYEDAYHQFIEPVVGASGDRVGQPHASKTSRD